MMRKFAHLIINLRWLILISVFLNTAFFAYQLKNLKIEQSLSDIMPKEHPYIKLQGKFLDIFGGTNLVSIGLRVKEGNIFNLDTLAKIYRITYKLGTLDGVVPYRIVSIASRKLRYTYTDVDPKSPQYPTFHNPGLITMVKEIITDGNMELLETYKNKAIMGDSQIYGSLVSKDLKGTVILADFWAEENFKYIFENIRQTLKEEEDGNTSFHIGGRPILLGYISLYMKKVLGLFGLAIGVILLMLYLHFRTIRGVLVPFIAGCLTVTWGVGVVAFWGLRVDMMSVTVPFLLMAMEVSHAVQKVNRYYEEFIIHGDNKIASQETIVGLFLPGLTAILTDALGFAFLFFLPFKIIQSMALMASFGVLRMTITTLITIPCLLSVLPAPKAKEIQKVQKRGILEKLLYNLSKSLQKRVNQGIVIALSIIMLCFSAIGASQIVVGDLQPGEPFFWRDSKYNQDDHVLSNSFAGTNPYYIVIDTKERNGLFDPQLAKDVEALENHLRQRPDVAYTLSYTDILKKMNKAWHNNESHWEILPEDRNTIGEFFFDFIGSVEPEVTRPYFDMNNRYANIQVVLRDHRCETIKSIIKDTEEFLTKNKNSNAHILQAGGIIGIFAAIIEEIEKGHLTSIYWIFLFCLIFSIITFRSFAAGLIIFFYLGLGTLITYAVMGFGKIGLFLYTVPVATMGTGLGVDYGLYILARIRDEVQGGTEVSEAFNIALTTAGKAVLFTVMAIGFGVLTLLISDLRFQAIMGVMLLVILVANMAGSLILLPVIISLWKPRFIYSRRSPLR